MSLNIKEMFSGILSRGKEPRFANRVTRISERPIDTHSDDEKLTEEVPYKLEPNLAEVERYLDRIRRQGL